MKRVGAATAIATATLQALPVIRHEASWQNLSVDN